jgi:hypothetical protein
MWVAVAHPKHPSENVRVETKKHALLPKISEKRPYKGWKAALVIRYDVVSHDALLAALNSELIRAYVEAVTVPSKPERKTLAQSAACSAVSKAKTCQTARGTCLNPPKPFRWLPARLLFQQQGSSFIYVVNRMVDYLLRHGHLNFE